jgi:hypothetical protein
MITSNIFSGLERLTPSLAAEEPQRSWRWGQAEDG